jgi:glutaconate CoA-transferase subunit B
MDHAEHRLNEKVARLTSPGYETGNGSRQSPGLPEGTGPLPAVTTRGVLRLGRDGEPCLASIHPGVSVEEVLWNTGWPLRVAMLLGGTELPTAAGIGAMRPIDPQRFWTGE